MYFSNLLQKTHKTLTFSSLHGLPTQCFDIHAQDIIRRFIGIIWRKYNET